MGKYNLWDAAKELVKGEMTLVNSEEYDRRMDLCHGCPRLTKHLTICKECGCNMKLKCAIKNASCPLDKW